MGEWKGGPQTVGGDHLTWNSQPSTKMDKHLAAYLESQEIQHVCSGMICTVVTM